MNNRWKNALLVIPIYGAVVFIMGYIVEGKPVWNLVISSVIAGFLLVVFILLRMEKKRLAKEKKTQNSLEDH